MRNHQHCPRCGRANEATTRTTTVTCASCGKAYRIDDAAPRLVYPTDADTRAKFANVCEARGFTPGGYGGEEGPRDPSRFCRSGTRGRIDAPEGSRVVSIEAAEPSIFAQGVGARRTWIDELSTHVPPALKIEV